MPSLCANRSRKKLRACWLGFPPGAVPSEPPSFVVAEGLPSCDARPPRQNHWPPVKINPLVIAATHMIGTHAPPERQRRPEQPIAQALHLNGKRGGQSHRVAHRSANVPCKRMFRGNCQLRPSANRTAATAGQIATAVANRVGRHDGIATAPLSPIRHAAAESKSSVGWKKSTLDRRWRCRHGRRLRRQRSRPDSCLTKQYWRCGCRLSP